MSAGREWLTDMLRRWTAEPQSAAQIERAIVERFGRRCAVMVLDMSGFSRMTLRHGVLHFLSIVRRMADLSEPLVQQAGGACVKQEADNLYAVFDSVDAAVDCATAILRAMDEGNTRCVDDQRLYAAIGIGWGDVLLIDGSDFYGNEVNLACKLGEDLAQSGEILLTAAAFAACSDPGGWRPMQFSISGIEILAHLRIDATGTERSARR